MLLDKNTKKPTIYPQGYGTHLRQWVWNSHCWVWDSYMFLCEYQDLNRSLFLDCSTRSEAEGRVCKVCDQVFCRIYGHDLKLEEYIKENSTSWIASTSSLVMYTFRLEVSGRTLEFGHLKTAKGFRFLRNFNCYFTLYGSVILVDRELKVIP